MSTAKMFVPASLIMALATVVLGVQTSFAEPATDDCKTTPGSSAPAGQHWYYRINRSDQRHCWYLGAEGTKVRAQTREKASPPPARTAREEAPEMTPTMPPPMEVIQTPSAAPASSQPPAAPDVARPMLDLAQAPDPAPREPAITSNASAPEATERSGKCHWCGPSSPTPNVRDRRMPRAGPLPGQLFSSLVERCWLSRRSSSSLGAHVLISAGLRRCASRARGSKGGLNPPTRPPRHAQAARKSALRTRRDARPRRRATSTDPPQLPNPRSARVRRARARSFAREARALKARPPRRRAPR